MTHNLEIMRSVNRGNDVHHRVGYVVGGESSSHDKELNSARGIELSVDLVSASKRLLGFLRTIDSIMSLHSGFAVRRAILRLATLFIDIYVVNKFVDQFL